MTLITHRVRVSGDAFCSVVLGLIFHWIGSVVEGSMYHLTFSYIILVCCDYCGAVHSVCGIDKLTVCLAKMTWYMLYTELTFMKFEVKSPQLSDMTVVQSLTLSTCSARESNYAIPSTSSQNQTGLNNVVQCVSEISRLGLVGLQSRCFACSGVPKLLTS